MSYEYLEHHGILGQKWGIRRYQNKDGRYTSLGARRHAKAAEAAQEEKISRKEAKKLNKDAKSRLSGNVDQNTIGIYQKNGNILFVDRKIAEKYGPGVAEKKALEYIEKATRENTKLKKASDYAEAKDLVDELLKDFNGDSEELAVLKDLERSYK